MNAELAIPASVYGPWREVRPRLASAVRNFATSGDWHGALDAENVVAVGQTPGLIVLNGPAPLLAADNHFHVYQPLALLLEGVRAGRIDEARVQQAFLQSLGSPWGLLGLIAPKNQMLVYAPARHAPILVSAVRWWDRLNGVGPRYTVGLPTGARLWDVTNNLHYVLGQVGVAPGGLEAPLPAGGLKSILPAGVGD